MSYLNEHWVLCNIDPYKENMPMKNIISGEICKGVEGRKNCRECKAYINIEKTSKCKNNQVAK